MTTSIDTDRLQRAEQRIRELELELNQVRPLSDRIERAETRMHEVELKMIEQRYVPGRVERFEERADELRKRASKLEWSLWHRDMIAIVVVPGVVFVLIALILAVNDLRDAVG